ncbi:hypothetical protein AOXY_G18505 [Acipenser oxyrinchus oxyrinchus]|uniref:Uncharacterized protein n=1 Tax=Acipenser oxyrinchus oxyrinchus TaxID=40147 RepID=A0AAD8D4P4_ACIOX|nr:hypothetical protein AOXY_G18505 [Acipenser oxyrinchus oxyrinchus]
MASSFSAPSDRPIKRRLDLLFRSSSSARWDCILCCTSDVAPVLPLHCLHNVNFLSPVRNPPSPLSAQGFVSERNIEIPLTVAQELDPPCGYRPR